MIVELYRLCDKTKREKLEEKYAVFMQSYIIMLESILDIKKHNG